MTDKPLVIVQHMDWEGPGRHLTAALAEARADYRVWEAWHEPVPASSDLRGLIVLGGSPNVDEEEEFPYLKPLKALIQEVIDSGRPYLGFCLGHQLLGHVLGCEVGPLPRKSVGFITGELTPEGQAHPAFHGLPPRLPLFKWHGQGVLPPLPSGVVLLARSEAAPVEALGLANHPKVVGLQYDNHAAAADVAQWVAADAAWALSGTGVEPRALVAEAVAQEEAMGRGFRRFMANYLALL